VILQVSFSIRNAQRKLHYRIFVKRTNRKPLFSISHCLAPGAYNPEKPEHTPNYSFGLKTPIGKPSDTPGKIPLNMEKNSSKIFLELNYKLTSFLAPGAYNPDLPVHSPAYAFGLRTPIGKPSDTPGKLFENALYKVSVS